MCFISELDLADNPIADKRLLKLIQQCRTKQIVDYVKQHGTENTKKDGKGAGSSDKKKSNKKKSKGSAQKDCPQHKIIVQRVLDDTIKVSLHLIRNSGIHIRRIFFLLYDFVNR